MNNHTLKKMTKFDKYVLMLNSCYLPEDMGASAYWKMLPVTNRTTLTDKSKEKTIIQGH